MRCIEMQQQTTETEIKMEINSNMRCIEIDKFKSRLKRQIDKQ